MKNFFLKEATPETFFERSTTLFFLVFLRQSKRRVSLKTKKKISSFGEKTDPTPHAPHALLLPVLLLLIIIT